MLKMLFGRAKKGEVVGEIKKTGTDEEKMAAVGVDVPLQATGNVSPDAVLLGADGKAVTQEMSALQLPEDPLAGVRQPIVLDDKKKADLLAAFIADGFPADAAAMEVDRIVDMAKDQTKVPPEVDYILQLASTAHHFVTMLENVCVSIGYDRQKRQEAQRVFIRFGTVDEEIFTKFRILVRKQLIMQAQNAMQTLKEAPKDSNA